MNDATPVLRTTSSLPPAWDRPGIFVSNLFSLFFGNEGQTADLCSEVGRLESYGGRLVPVLGLMYQGDSPNGVVLEEPPAAEILAYFADELGLDVPDLHAMGHDDYKAVGANGNLPEAAAALFQELGAKSRGWIDGFVTDAALRRMAEHTGHETLNTPEASYAGNHKVMLHHHLVESRLPTFTSHLATSAEEIDQARSQLKHCGYEHAVIKSAVGASGVGLWKLPIEGPKTDVPDYCFHEGPCLVQGWLDDKIADVNLVASPSVQVFSRPEAVHLFDLTDQILSTDSIHEGNVSPPAWLQHEPDTQEEIMRQAAVVGAWLHGQGYRGTASVDFHVALRTGGPEVRVCEVNARVTGATYPALLARHFAPNGVWLMRNLRFDPAPPPGEALAELRSHGLLWQPNRAAGVLPINFNTVPGVGVTKGQFLCLAPELDEAQALLRRVTEVMDGAEDFARD